MPTFTWSPHEASKKAAPRVRTAAFGDGYQQRVGDGINVQPAEWSLTFVRRTVDADAIEAFLVARAGADSFTWTPPGEAAAIKVVCAEWNRQPLPGLLGASIAATFRQVFGE
jgi:phage-related protein